MAKVSPDISVPNLATDDQNINAFGRKVGQALRTLASTGGNATELQGYPIATTAPSSGTFLGWTGSAWAPLTPSGSSFTAAHDLSGTSTSQTVVGLQGRPVSSTAPAGTFTQYLGWSGSAWTPSTITIPTSLPPSGAAGGDLAGTYPNPTVAQLQTVPVAAAAPATGNVLTYNGSQWAGAVPATPLPPTSTKTTAAFIIPSVGSSVSVSVSQSFTFNTGQRIVVATAGHYEIASIPDGLTLVMTLIFLGPNAAGFTVSSGVVVAPLSASLETTTSITTNVPAIGSSVGTSVLSTDYLAVGTSVNLQGGGIFTINSLSGTHSVSLQNPTYQTQNALPGTAISSGAAVMLSQVLTPFNPRVTPWDANHIYAWSLSQPYGYRGVIENEGSGGLNNLTLIQDQLNTQSGAGGPVPFRFGASSPVGSCAYFYANGNGGAVLASNAFTWSTPYTIEVIGSHERNGTAQVAFGNQSQQNIGFDSNDRLAWLGNSASVGTAASGAFYHGMTTLDSTGLKLYQNGNLLLWNTGVAQTNFGLFQLFVGGTQLNQATYGGCLARVAYSNKARDLRYAQGVWSRMMGWELPQLLSTNIPPTSSELPIQGQFPQRSNQNLPVIQPNNPYRR